MISGTIAAGASNQHPYYASVTATTGTYSDTRFFRWDVPHPSNSVPVLVNPGSQANTESDMESLQLSASDADGDELIYTAEGLPEGLYLSPFTGLISGVLGSRVAGAQVHNVEVTVEDGHGGTAIQSFTWTVNSGQLAGQGANLNVDEGATFWDELVAIFTDQNYLSQADDFEAWIDWGDGSAELPGFVTGSDGVFAVSGSHVYEASNPNTYTITVRIDEGGGSSLTTTSTATVAPSTLAASGFEQTAVVGESRVFSVASFTDTNQFDDESTFTASINWGDGSSGLADAIVGDGGQFTVHGSHSYNSPGSYIVLVTITDKDGVSTQTVSLITVGNVMEAALAHLTVGEFQIGDSQSVPEDFTATIQWEEFGIPETAEVSGAAGVFSVSGDHIYYEPGTHTVVVTITHDPTQTTLTATGIVQVSEAPLAVYADSLVAKVVEVATTRPVGYYVNPDPTDGPENEVLINWGDGTESLASLSGGLGLFSLGDNKTYSQWRPFFLQVMVINTPLLLARAGKLTNVAPEKKLAIDGPTAVPGMSIYHYRVTFAPKAKIPYRGLKLENVTWDYGASPSVLDVGRSLVPTYDKAGLLWFVGGALYSKNVPGTVNLKLSFKVTQGGKTTTYETAVLPIHVVKVTVGPVVAGIDLKTKKPVFLPSFVAGKALDDQTVVVEGPTSIDGKPVENLIAKEVISQRVPESIAALQWNASIELQATNPLYLDMIKVSFVQHIQNPIHRVHFPAAAKYLIGITHEPSKKYLDVKDGPGPYYSSKPNAIFDGKDVRQGQNLLKVEHAIGSEDAPRIGFPVEFFQTKATKVEYVLNFDLVIVASTKDKANGADALLMREAMVHWSFNATGTIKERNNMNNPYQWVPLVVNMKPVGGIFPPDPLKWKTDLPPFGVSTVGPTFNQLAKSVKYRIANA